MVRRPPPPPEAPSGTPVGAGRGRSRARVAAWLVVGAIAATALIGVVAGVLRTPVALDTASPEATVQADVQAVLDGEMVSAYRHLDAAEAAEVRVRLRTTQAPDPFGIAEYDEVEVFDLVVEDSAWRISGPPWPIGHDGAGR